MRTIPLAASVDHRSFTGLATCLRALGRAMRVGLTVLLLLVPAACDRTPTLGDDYTQTIRARAHLENGDTAHAIKLLRQVASEQPSARAWCNLGWALQVAQEEDKAAEAWRKAVALDTYHVRSNFHLASWEHRRSAGRNPEEQQRWRTRASEHLDRARTFEPRNAAVLRLLAQVQQEMGRTKLADSLMQQAEWIDPGRAGRVPEAFGLAQIVPPEIERAPSVTRHAPRFHAQKLEVQALGVVEVPVVQPAHASGVLLLGTRAWLRNAATLKAESIRWAVQPLGDQALQGGVSAPLDADRIADAVFWSRAESARMRTQVWLATGTQDSLRVRALRQLAYDVTAMVAIDLDADGDVDLLVGASGPPGVRVWRNDGNGGFDAEESEWFQGAPPMHALYASDLNGDHIQDLVTLDEAGNVSLWVGQRHGSFYNVTERAGLGGLRARAVALADLDGDGRDDLLLGDDEALWIHRNEGGLRFQRNAAYRDARGEWSGEQERGVPVASIQVADFDNDGKLDVFTQHFKDPQARRVLAQTGYGETKQLAARVGTSEDTAPRRTTPLLEVPDRVRVALWRNEGHGILTDVTVQAGLDAQWTRASLPVLADLDQDGDLDVLCVGVENHVQLLWNRSEGLNRRIVFEWTDAQQARRAHAARVEAFAGRRVLQARPRPGGVGLGIGTLDAVDVVRLRWTDGTVHNLFDLSGLRVASGDDQRLVLQLPATSTATGFSARP